MSLGNYSQAISDFRRARRKAGLRSLFARWEGKSPRLLSYEDVRRKLKAKETSKSELREIPLDSIVGSVGRYDDFTRGFLPRQDSDEGRWARVKVAVTGLGGLPPIEVYQIGEAYFVLDGNHRVSVARDVGATHIQAYVRQAETKVPLSPDVQPDDLIIKAEYAEFLDRTSFDEIVPGADMTVTSPGRYPVLEGQILTRRDHLRRTEDRELSLNEAVQTWYQQVYLPTVGAIREQGLLKDFPRRTETDLYVWISQHRAELEGELGWEVRPESVASNLAAQSSPRVARRLSRVKDKLLDALTPDAFEAGPAPGKWRRAQVAVRAHERFAVDILVALSEEDSNWSGVEQALIFAQRERARLQGLHVVKSESQKESEISDKIRSEFERRCQEAGVSGRFAIEIGGIARKICERARWSDLVVVNLAHPPGSSPVAKLGSGIRTMIARCPRPLLAVPQVSSRLESALLAYDGSPKAHEALFLATYLAGQWDIPLILVGVQEGSRPADRALRDAQLYLERHEIQPATVIKTGPVGRSILETVAEHDCELILMGGYGHTPTVEMVLGSAVNQVLADSPVPLLICR